MRKTCTYLAILTMLSVVVVTTLGPMELAGASEFQGGETCACEATPSHCMTQCSVSSGEYSNCKHLDYQTTKTCSVDTDDYPCGTSPSVCKDYGVAYGHDCGTDE